MKQLIDIQHPEIGSKQILISTGKGKATQVKLSHLLFKISALKRPERSLESRGSTSW
jgi:hypothetical protein